AERGVLVSLQGEELQIEAEATARGEHIALHLPERGARIAGALPESLIRYAMRTRETVILDDALPRKSLSAHSYLARGACLAILCLPLITRAKFIGILYLENSLTPCVFTPDRVTVLKVLASQAAISFENARLYRDLADREGKIRRLVDANIIGTFIWRVVGPN